MSSARKKPTTQRAEVMSKLESRMAEPSPFDDLPGTSAPIAKAQPATARRVIEDPQERIKGIEDKLFERSLAVVMGCMEFYELPDDAQGPPAEWIEAEGYDRAIKRFRLARAGGLGPKEAPIAIKTATAVVAAVTKARATEKAGPRTLAIQFVQMSAPLPDFPRRIVENTEK